MKEKMKIPVVNGVEEIIRNPLIKGGKANFIQVYLNEIPYFRAGEEKHCKILEKFLEEVNINDFEKAKRDSGCFHSYFVPAKKEKLYELVGCGIIEEATLIKENINELEGRGHIAIRGYSEEYNLYPNIKHLSKILKHFGEPLIFAGSGYWTEEQRGFVEDYDEENVDDGIFDGEPLENEEAF